MDTNADGGKMNATYSLAVQFDDLVKKWNHVLNSAINKSMTAVNGPSNDKAADSIYQLDDVLFRLRLWAGDIATKHGEGGPISTVATLEMLEAIGSDIVPVLRDIFNRMDAIPSNFESDLEPISDKNILDTAEELSHAIDDLDMHREKIREKISKFGGRYKSNKPLAILCFDGGGLRSYASLLVLRELMAELSSLSLKTRLSLKEDTYALRPRDFFDFIFGSSSGGLIAILLGRLHMTVDECIERFQTYAEDIFTNEDGISRLLHPLGIPVQGARQRGIGLEKALQKAILEFDPSHVTEEWKKDRFSVPGDPCNTGVIATQVEGPGDTPSPYIFRTYDNSKSPWPPGSSPTDPYTIVDVARATSAAPPLLKPFKMHGATYIDGGFNNPSELAWIEVKSCLNLENTNSSRGVILVSFGTGHVSSRVEAAKHQWLPPIGSIRRYARLAMRIITDTETVHHHLQNELKDDYFRFDVKEIGHVSLDDWRVEYRKGEKIFVTLDEIETAVREYIANTREEIRKCAARLLSYRRDFTNAHDTEKNGLWVVPFGRNRDFVGREAIMERLLQIVPPGVDEDDCQRTAIQGLGGVGKTQIALEAAFRVYNEHQGCSVFWVPAVDATSFENAYREIGRQLDIEDVDNKPDVKSLVKAALSCESAGSWLLIIDNVDDVEEFFGNAALSDALPFSRKGSILFTTRNREVAVRLDISARNLFTTAEMNRAEAIALSQRRLNDSQTRDTKSLNDLLDFLADLPLAITQASAYMATTGMPPAKYLNHCQSSNNTLIQLLSKEFDDRGRYKNIRNPIATTWWISFGHILRDHPLAARYLRFMCFLAEKEIPASLLPPEDELEMDAAIGTLKAYAFITEREESRAFDIHRLVRLAMQNFLEKQDEQVECITEVIQRLAELFPFPRHENRDIWMRYLPHVQSALEFRKPSTGKEAESNLLHNVAWSYSILGEYQKAEQMHQQAFKLRERLFGKEHPDTLASMGNLALVFKNQGKYQEAEQLHRQTLELMERVLGTEHPNTLASMNNLALLLDMQGKYKEAEHLYRQALELMDKALSKGHPNRLASLNSLGSIFYSQGKYEKAEQIYRETFKIRTEVLGEQHPETLSSMNNLANMLDNQGKYSEAEEMHREILHLRGKVLGREHPDTLASMNNLAFILYNQGRYEEAKLVLQEAIHLKKKVLGEEHPDTLTSMNNLAVIKPESRRFAPPLLATPTQVRITRRSVSSYTAPLSCP